LALVIACRPPSPRALDPAEVVAVAEAQGVAAEVVEDIGDAVARARSWALDDDLVFVTGSLYVVGEARRAILGHPPRVLPASPSRT
jgi:dihydrofolate synthase/folylpolyglutamate synthase